MGCTQLGKVLCTAPRRVWTVLPRVCSPNASRNDLESSSKPGVLSTYSYSLGEFE